VPVSWAALAVAFVVTTFASGVQRNVGFGLAVVSVPILELLDPALAPVPQLLMSLPLTITMAWSERHALDVKGAGWVIAGRIPGALIGVALILVVTDRALDALIGLAVLGAVVILATGVHVHRTPATQFGAGVASGTSGLVASIGGPPLALLYRNDRGDVIRSSLAAIFTIGIMITITARGLVGAISRDDIVVALLLFPALLLGFVVGSRFLAHVEGRPLRIATLSLSAFAAAILLLRAVAS
jgi:uncharacterized membrane protein YfcA